MKIRKIIALVLALSLSFALCACSEKSGGDKHIYKIGISQYAQHSSLDNCRTGFIQGLEEAGLKEGVDFEIIYQNAGADDNTVLQIAQSFTAQNVDLMCAIATPSAVACFAEAEDKDIPVIFTAITDPVEAKLDKGNITGTSDKLPVTEQLGLIRKMQPDAKTIGIVYTLSEPNSVSAIREYESAAPRFGFNIETVGITSQAEAVQAVETLINKKVDCFSNLTDNNVVNVLPAILERTNEASIPVYGSEIEQVKLGCVASAGIEYVSLGVETGKMAAKILKGEAKASEMPYVTISAYETYLNEKAAQTLGITVPKEISDSAVLTAAE